MIIYSVVFSIMMVLVMATLRYHGRDISSWWVFSVPIGFAAAFIIGAPSAFFYGRMDWAAHTTSGYTLLKYVLMAGIGAGIVAVPITLVLTINKIIKVSQ